MKITLITPAKKHSKNGNRTSALRWAKFLRELGHHVSVESLYTRVNTDLMIALHAWRSADSITSYRSQYPNGPLIVALGGTDINTYLKTNPVVTMRSMDLADILIGLHDLIKDVLPPRFHNKLHIIKQSASPLLTPRSPAKRFFDICVVGHLREEKDPFCASRALRHIRHESKLRIIHLGKAHSQNWANKATSEMVSNPRYIWKGEVAKWQVRREFIKTHLMVISSRQEGGANVVSEAIVAGVPIIASHIPGNIGILGSDYPGYFPVGNSRALATLLHRAESDPRFLELLGSRCHEIRPSIMPKTEADNWERVIKLATKK
ncbi:MAG: TIGR04348 family glycosyltransferase [Magnetovibrio sp.]|nr:TIGR04348 family glycosyltransferase [Magnetovibrio sp.]